MIEGIQEKSTSPKDAEIPALSYEPPRLVSFGDAVERTMGDEGSWSEKKALSGYLGSGN